MTEHVDPTVLAALAEGRLPEIEAAGARRTIASCPHCARHLEDLTLLLRLTARGDGAHAEDTMTPTDLPKSLDLAFERVIATQTAKPVMRRRAWFPIAAAAAAVMLVVLLTQRGATPAPPLALRGHAVLLAGPEGLRTASGETLHFEVRVNAAVHLAIFRVGGENVDVVYPDPNPALGTYGRTDAFRPGEAIRIPPTPLADLPASRGAGQANYFAVASKTSIGQDALGLALAAARKDARFGAGAVAAALAARFDAVTELDVTPAAAPK